MTFQDFLDSPITAIDFNDGSFVHDTCDYSDEYCEQVTEHLVHTFGADDDSVCFESDGVYFSVDGEIFFLFRFELPAFAPHCLEQSGGTLC